MEISIKKLKKFTKDFANIVKPLEEEYGVTIKLGTISYEEERFSTKMTVTNGRDPDDVARVAFDADVWRYEHLGLKPGMYNRICITGYLLQLTEEGVHCMDSIQDPENIL